MKVKFLKDHLQNKQDDVIDISDPMGDYWLRTGVAEKVEIEQKKEKVEMKPNKEKKEK